MRLILITDLLVFNKILQDVVFVLRCLKIKHCGHDATFNVYDFSKLTGVMCNACNVFLSGVFIKILINNCWFQLKCFLIQVLTSFLKPYYFCLMFSKHLIYLFYLFIFIMFVAEFQVLTLLILASLFKYYKTLVLRRAIVHRGNKYFICFSVYIFFLSFRW